MTPFIAGVSTAFLGVLPLGLAVWLVTRAAWSSRTRVTAVLGLLAATVALFVGLLALVLHSNAYN
ncbi:MAG TPA: hypothetical protein VJ716_10685 [Gaiellaceae bacterium]|nr:hypothetical protein [Gaiellaceae bacterium]